TQALEELLGSLPDARRRHVVEGANELHELEGAQPVVEERPVGNEAEPGSGATRLALERGPGDRHLALVRFEQAGTYLERGGLAGPVRAQESHDLAVSDLEVDLVDGSEAA